MIDEKIVIRDIENRIDTFVKQSPKEKDCRLPTSQQSVWEIFPIPPLCLVFVTTRHKVNSFLLLYLVL